MPRTQLLAPVFAVLDGPADETWVLPSTLEDPRDASVRGEQGDGRDGRRGGKRVAGVVEIGVCRGRRAPNQATIR